MRTLALIAALLMTGVELMNFPLKAVEILKPHRWNHRILMVFSPRADDLRARAFDDRLAELSCELEDRDLIVGRIPAFGDARLGRAVLTPDLAFQLRRHFGVDAGDFAVILVGKDGLEKLRSDVVPEPEALFQLIDGMPMRIAEIRERNAACPS